jgi:hypothetical protein
MSEVYLNSICISYRIFKDKFGFEDYLIRLSPSLRRNFFNFRLSQHRLPIQMQRYVDTPREERICLLCDGREVGDEFHYLFKCTYPLLKDSRKNLIPKYFQHHPNALKFRTLMNSNSGKLTKLCRFIKTILSLFWYNVCYIYICWTCMQIVLWLFVIFSISGLSYFIFVYRPLFEIVCSDLVFCFFFLFL